jgi:hypothetical protein
MTAMSDVPGANRQSAPAARNLLARRMHVFIASVPAQTSASVRAVRTKALPAAAIASRAAAMRSTASPSS